MAGGKQSGVGQRDAFDFAGFAQEFLRRNPDYRRDFHRIERVAVKCSVEEREVMARRWGLCFPLRAGRAPRR